MTLRRRQTRAETIELVVQPLPQHLQLGHELAAMPDDAEQRLQCWLLRSAAEPLPGKPDKGRAVTIVGLEPARAKLRPRRLRLRRRQQTNPSREATLELRRPRPVQRTRRLDRDQRLAPDPAATDQPLQLVDAFPQRWQRDR